jgi:hypothetical protein
MEARNQLQFGGLFLSMELLEPDWKQVRPTPAEVQEMCRQISLEQASLPALPFDKFLQEVRQNHDNGGAYLVAFDVGANLIFDWFASRNRLTDERLLDSLLVHPAIRRGLADLLIPDSPKSENGFTLSDQFEFDGKLAHTLYHGGAYGKTQGNGRTEKLFALDVCEAMFGLRFGEITCYLSYAPWTSWFRGIAWDLTAIIFDRRTRRLWALAVTDTD